MNKANEVVMKSQTSKSINNEVPVETIEGFSKVKLEEESLLGPTLEMERMNNFLGDNNIGRNMPIRDKSSLGVVNVVGKMRLKPIRKRFR